MKNAETNKLTLRNVIANIDLYLSVMLFAFIVSVTFLFVITRYFYSVSLPGLEEISVIIFIWFLYIAMIHSMRNDAHIRVNIIDLFLDNKWKLITSIISNVILFAFNCAMIVFTARLVFYNLGPFAAKSIIIGVPDYVSYAILPFSFAVFSVLTAATIYRDFERLKDPDLDDESLGPTDIENPISNNPEE